MSERPFGCLTDSTSRTPDGGVSNLRLATDTFGMIRPAGLPETSAHRGLRLRREQAARRADADGSHFTRRWRAISICRHQKLHGCESLQQQT